ncbi:MAG: threonylcarbamoyl-AMP synthase, partial [Pseudarthrobacter sp.]
RTGQAPAQTAAEARAQLAESVEVYLEGGFRPVEGTDAVHSTIVDATGPVLRVVRNGAVSLDQLREHVPGVLGLGEVPAAEPADAVPAEGASEESVMTNATAAEDTPTAEGDRDAG